MRAGVITFPGSNCDEDVSFVLEKSCAMQVDRLWHKDAPALGDYGLIVLPGGFSYGDYLRCGAIASMSPIMERVKEFAGAGGMVMGICNGFQILCETRLVPGALAQNEKSTFICKDVALKTESASSPWTRELKEGEVLRIPIAHGEGRYIVTEDEYVSLKKNGQILFSYTENPNGSTHSIAGVCNAEKNVFGLMPHPERATDLRTREATKIWQSVMKSLQEKHGNN